MNINKYIFLAAFFLLSTALTANEITGSVTSSESGEGISFASIFLRQKNIGIVSDIDGHYRLPLDILEETGDTLIFSSIGFDVLRIPVALFAEKVSAGNTDIVLTANYVLLPEVSVTPSRPRDYGLFHRRTTFIAPLVPPARVMVFVENTSNTAKLIQTVNVKLLGIESEYREAVKLRIFFYQKDETGFRNINVAGGDIFVTDFSQSEIRHDVSEHHILFPAEGIYVGIEVIPPENVVQDLSQDVFENFLQDNIMERVGFIIATTGRRRGYTYLFSQGHWINTRETVVEHGREIPPVIRGVLRRMNPKIGITAH
jgi:hypothetical protein